MSESLRKRIFEELDTLVLIDPHTHIPPLSPAATTLADVLGYHYYTELAHSAGMDRRLLEEPGLSPREQCRRLVEHLGPLENTVQYSWLIELSRELFGFYGDRVGSDNWEALYDEAEARMAQPGWSAQVLEKSRLEAVFLTNEFDDALDGFDTQVYVPCLRTDDLVFHLAKPEVRERLTRASGVFTTNAQSLRTALGKLFEHFVAKNARACAISLPPEFAPARVAKGRADTAVAEVWEKGGNAHASHRQALAQFVFWTLAELCDGYRMPFDLMIGVHRGVYAAGVYQGRDLYDSRVSLIQYKDLFNAFPRVKFPVSVLASVTNQELVSYTWIFPNVIASGHWWYSNTPAFIERDLAARLEAAPGTKQIGYYSDAYKLEFVLPKFRMYKRVLAKVLADRFVIDRGWSEERAVALGRQVLRGNVDRVFARPEAIEVDAASLAASRLALAATAAAGAGGVLAAALPFPEAAGVPEASAAPESPGGIDERKPATPPDSPDALGQASGPASLPREPAEAPPADPAATAHPADDPLSFLGPAYRTEGADLPYAAEDDGDDEPLDDFGLDRPQGFKR